MTEIRRKDRAMPEAFAWELLDTCEYAFLGMVAENGEPYVLPITPVRDGKDVYFHCAIEGRKVRCLRQNPRVCLTCVGRTEIQQERFTTLYESAVAFGTAAEITEQSAKLRALRLLCLRHTPDAMEGFEKAVSASISRTAIWRITVDEISAKSKR